MLRACSLRACAQEGRPVCARMCPCAHIVGADMLVTVSKNGFSLLSKPWHHYWIILSLLPPSWCGIVHFGGRVLGSAARTFFARMCAGMAARPVCARMCACRCAHTVGAHMLGSKCCALVFCAHVRRKMAGRPVCARMCPCAHIVGAHMLVRTVSKNGFSLLSKPWHHYWIILSLLPPSWCGIVHFGGRVLGSAARAFFCAHVRRNGSASSMCAHVSLRAHCRQAYASYASSANLQTWNPIRWVVIAWQALGSIIYNIYQYFYYY